jgi:hypothetical protein
MRATRPASSAHWIWLIACCAICGVPDARADDHAERPWAFQPAARPEVPPYTPDDATLVRNPIDAFIVAELRANDLAPAPEADRRTLIRRVTFDLTGLPPTPEEVEAFLADERPDAYERLVDRLLASPAFGERWARHWLDVARYAETQGYERDDPKPNAWKYRDYVVGSLNADKPYDRFLVEQLAGDELPDASAETRTATGLHRLGLIDDEPADPVMDRFDQLDDMVKTVGTTFLGISIHCARCHDHKFDPIRQEDYYRLVAFFEPGKPYVRDQDASISLVLATAEEQRRVDELNQAVDRQVEAARERLKAVPESDTATRSAIEKAIERFDKTRPAALPMALGLTDRGPTADPTHLLIRGDAHRPGAEVAPGFVRALEPATPEIVPPPSGATTGRRMALARWIASADNPLTARVVVNRLWHHHFGRGIVGTPSDFGAMGDAPTHPELLDWLAAELVERGWSLKAMHRLIVTSAAYRRSTRWDDAAGQVDPENTLLWRRTPRRLEAEPIRDAVLAVSGSLNTSIGGPSVRPKIDPAVLAGQSRPGNGWRVSKPRDAARRSLYVLVKRTLPLPELEVLDAADSNDVCPKRTVTTTAPQALTLLNGAFQHEQAARFAERLRREAGDDPARQIERAFRLALARPPTDDERAGSIEFLARQAELIRERPKPEDRADPNGEALRAFALVLLNCNEFLTVD